MAEQEQVIFRFACKISYDGTGYFGWQGQKESRNTVQGVIEEKLGMILNEEIEIVGCGRTDSGVHAKGYVFHFDTCNAKLDAESIVYKMNKLLDGRIVFHSCVEMKHDFHARFDAVSRSYIYRIRTNKDPFDNRFTWHYPYRDDLDIDVLNSAGKLISEFDDFNTFCKTGTNVKTTLCEIRKCYWSYNDQDGVVEFRVTANRFLRGMIRLLVGAQLNVNRGKLDMKLLRDALCNKKRLKLDWSVPACGLMLYDIEYTIEL